MIDYKTVNFIGILNDLTMRYRRYGIAPLSSTKKFSDFFEGIVYDDTKEIIDGVWHSCPIVISNEHMEDYPNIKFEVAWSDGHLDSAPWYNPCIWVYDDENDICYHIEKDGWYV